MSLGGPTFGSAICMMCREPRFEGHHDHGVLEVHGAAPSRRSGGHRQHLQQHVEDVRMRLLDFIEQHNAVGLAPDTASSGYRRSS